MDKHEMMRMTSQAIQAYKEAERAEEAERASIPIDYNRLAIEIREVNALNGWNLTKPEEWEDKYKFPAVVALIHSEISEAWEAESKGDRANYLEECADVAIRILDCIGCWTDVDVNAMTEKAETNQPYHMNTLGHLHAKSSRALEMFRGSGGRSRFVAELIEVMVGAKRLCEFHGGDFHEEIRRKLAKNRERGHRHGGKKM